MSQQFGKEKTSDDRELCKPLIDEEIQSILNIKKVFERPFEKVKAFLYEVDSGCRHGHYAKVIQSDNNSEYVKELLGHPIQRAAGMCESPLRLLRQAAVHYPVIRSFLVSIYSTIASSKLIEQIDAGFCSEFLKDVINCKSLCDLFVESAPDDEPIEELSTLSCDDEDTETALQVKYADTICEYEKNWNKTLSLHAVRVNVSYWRKNVTMFNYYDEKFSSDILTDLKDYLLQNDPGVIHKLLYAYAGQF